MSSLDITPTQGRGIKNLHDSWRKMTFEPETDDIKILKRY